MIKRTQIIKELKRIGVHAFDSQDTKSVDFYVDRNGIDLNFWNVDQVLTHDDGYITGRMLSVRFLTKQTDSIHCASFYRELKDFADISLNDLKACGSCLDLKALVHSKAALGLIVRGES
jgi:hypothetical protein